MTELEPGAVWCEECQNHDCQCHVCRECGVDPCDCPPPLCQACRARRVLSG